MTPEILHQLAAQIQQMVRVEVAKQLADTAKSQEEFRKSIERSTTACADSLRDCLQRLEIAKSDAVHVFQKRLDELTAENASIRKAAEEQLARAYSEVNRLIAASNALMAALREKPQVFRVEPTPVTVEVAAPQVTVNPEVQLKTPPIPRDKKVTIVRNPAGQITSARVSSD